MNDENLIPIPDRAKSVQREIRSKGGKAAAKVRREKRTMRELIEAMGNLPIKSKGKIVGIPEAKSFEAMDGQNMTVNEFIIYKLIEGMASGDPKFYDLWGKYSGAYNSPPVQESSAPITEALKSLRDGESDDD